MPAVFDASSIYSTAGASSISGTHTPVGVPTGVGIAITWRAGTPPTISSVTYGGQACALQQLEDSGANDRTALYELANPPSGAQTVAVNFSGTCRGHIGTISVTGGDTTTVFSNTAKATGGGTFSITVTSATDELVMDNFGGSYGGDIVPDAAQTQRWDATASDIHAHGSTKPATGTSTTFTWGSVGASWIAVAGSFKVAAAGGGFQAAWAINSNVIIQPGGPGGTA